MYKIILLFNICQMNVLFFSEVAKLDQISD
jgi:hypothetical protein